MPSAFQPRRMRPLPDGRGSDGKLTLVSAPPHGPINPDCQAVFRRFPSFPIFFVREGKGAEKSFPSVFLCAGRVSAVNSDSPDSCPQGLAWMIRQAQAIGESDFERHGPSLQPVSDTNGHLRTEGDGRWEMGDGRWQAKKIFF